MARRTRTVESVQPQHGLRVAVITNMPAPYRDQLFNALAHKTSSLKVYYTELSTTYRNWEVQAVDDAQCMRPIVQLGSWGTLCRGVIGVVSSCDVLIVGGYDQPTYAVALLVGRLARRRVVLFFDGIAPSRLHDRGLRQRFKRILTRLPHANLANGASGREYFVENLRVPADRVSNQYLVPVKVLDRDIDVARVEDHVLFVGRLIARKGVAELLAAVRTAPTLSLTIAGDGPLRDHLEMLAVGLHVEFVGEIGRAEVSAEMRRATCLVVPSVDEPWGLVVQEALDLNLAVVASADMGCVADLIADGINGVIVHDLSPTVLAQAIELAMSLDRDALERHNAEVLSTWNLESHVGAFVEAIYGDVHVPSVGATR